MDLQTLVRGRLPPRAGALALIIAISIGLVVVFLLLGQAARDGHPYGWDTSASGFLHRHEHDSGAGRIPDLMVDWGGAATFAAGFVLLAIVVVRRRGRQLLFLLAAGASVLILTPLFKEQFERSSAHFSYPSGNASGSAAVAAAAIVIAWSTRLRWPTLVLGLVGTGALGLALVYKGWHRLSDVLGGWCLGIACAGAAWLAVAAWQRKTKDKPSHSSASRQVREAPLADTTPTPAARRDAEGPE